MRCPLSLVVLRNSTLRSEATLWVCGQTLTLWWQLLSVGFQKEREGVMSQKAISSLQIEGDDPFVALDLDIWSLVPYLMG